MKRVQESKPVSAANPASTGGRCVRLRTPVVTLICVMYIRFNKEI